MMTLPGWRYYRNLSLLLVAGIVSLFASSRAYSEPIHWLWAIPLFYLAWLVWGAFSFTHPRRMRYWTLAGPEFASPVYEKILFKSRDGLTLFGWYLPGRNRAALILAHGLGGSGLAMQIHAAPLVRAGYSVFLVDLRAHASSDGDTSTYGVLEADDIAGAVDYLLSREDVDPDKIGVLGISLGAQSALRGALQSEAIRALVLEGLGPASIEDRIRPASVQERSKKLLMLWNKIVYTVILIEQWVFNFFSGQRPTPLTAEIGKIVPRPILLIACGKHEIDCNRRFQAAAQASCTLWELPKARHAAALAYEPREYPRRIIAFFDHALRLSHGS